MSRLSSETCCPDLVGQPALSHPHLFSSLPDVSSIGHRSETGTVGDVACKPAESESFHLQPTGNPEVPQLDKDVNSDEVKLEMDAQFKRNHRKINQTIPDCIVESVMNEEHQGDEMPVAFSETIGQRVRRERPTRRSCFDNLEPADLVKDANRSDRKVGDTERTKEEESQRSELLVHEGEQGSTEMDFTGDWPSEGALEQRLVRRGERHKERNGEADEATTQQSSGTQNGLPSGANITEFQKLLDLIQTGVADIQIEDFTSSSLSSSSEEDLESNKEETDRCGNFDGKENEENMAVNHNQGELPDFVLDQKMSDKSCNTVVALMDDWGVLKPDNEMNIIKEGVNETGSLALKSASTSPLLDFNIRPLALSETVEENIRHDGEEELVADLIDIDDSKHPCASFGADGSENSESCSSPVWESSVGGNRERKQRQGRRPGKQCKLALTFPQNCPRPSMDRFSVPVNTKGCQEMSHTTTFEHLNSEWKTSGEPNSDLSTHSRSKAQPRLPSPLLPVGVREAASSQTEPQDFAFLWRLSNQNSLDKEFIATYSQLHDIVVLSGNSSRFEVSAAAPTLIHKEVPYHVMHDKSTQIEDKDLGVIQDRLESLRILSRHFKLVSFDTLADLYDKCHQDLDWTTNLLLDSGEIFFREEDGDHKLKDGAEGEGHEIEPVLENITRPDVIEEHHNDHQPVEFEERAVQSAIEMLAESDQSSSNLSGGHFETTLANKVHSETTPLLETPPQTEHQATNAGGRCTEHEEEVGSEVDQDSGAWGGNWEDGLIKEATIETENELASMEAVSALLQAEIKRIEEEEKEKETPRRRHVGAGRSQHLDIQSVEMKLPTEVALQLIELFGPVGANPGKRHRK